jgi:hypothetical protein
VAEFGELALDQFMSRLATFTDPNPVARSYPAPAVYAITFPPAVVVKTPTLELLVALQLGAPPVQGTAIFPVVTSWNAVGKLVARRYNTKFASPCLCPVC